MTKTATNAAEGVALDAYSVGYADGFEDGGRRVHCINCIYWQHPGKGYGECLLPFEKDSPVSLVIHCRHSDHDDATLITERDFGCTRGKARS